MAEPARKQNQETESFETYLPANDNPENPVTTSDAARGISNAATLEKKASTEHAQSVEARFEGKSMSAKLKRRYVKKTPTEDEFVSDIGVERRNNTHLNRGRVEKATKTVATKTTQIALQRMYVRALPYILGFLFIMYIWQMLFGIISLTGIGLHTYIEVAQTGNVLERAIGSVISFVQTLTGTAPAEALGMTFFGLNALLSTLTFIVLLGIFQIIGIKPFGSVTSFLATSVFFLFSLFPPTNLLPWLIVWVLYLSFPILLSNRK